MNFFFTISNYPVSFIESQMSFSGDVLKQHYAVVLAANGLGAYRTAQILDYLFMLSYGTIYFCLALMIARRFDITSRWRQSGYYIAIAGIGTLIMSLTGLNFQSALGAVATSVVNVGPAIGSVGPVSNFAHLTDFGKWFLSFLMLMGRLELFTILILFSPAFWKN